MPRVLTNEHGRTVSAYLPDDLAQRARTHAMATGRSLSSLIVESVAAYFQRLDVYAAIDREEMLQQFTETATGQLTREVA